VQPQNCAKTREDRLSAYALWLASLLSRLHGSCSTTDSVAWCIEGQPWSQSQLTEEPILFQTKRLPKRFPLPG
jgi:hypothetical protein